MHTVLVDVRTAKEFADQSIPGAINIPSNSYTAADYAQFANAHICLICESGSRANAVRQELMAAGFANVSLLDKHMAHLAEQLPARTQWTVDRQFRLALAMLLGVFLLGYVLNQAALIFIPIVLFSGLLYSAVSNNCYLKEFIAVLPWNRTRVA